MEMLIKSILCKHIPIDDNHAWGQSQKEEIWNEEEIQNLVKSNEQCINPMLLNKNLIIQKVQNEISDMS